MQTLAGKGALLVGTLRIGEKIAERLVEEGVRVVIAYRASQSSATKLLERLRQTTDSAFIIQGDISCERDAQKIVNGAVEKLQTLDFVVNLASDFVPTPLHSLDGNTWDHAMNAARGSYLLAINAYKKMLENEGPNRGHIINFGDWASDSTPYKNYLPYLTAKSAIHFMTRAFAVELAEEGILVNTIAPGPTVRPSDITQDLWLDNSVKAAPLKRESSVEDIANMVVALLKSETITGEVIRVDSGRHLVGNG